MTEQLELPLEEVVAEPPLKDETNVSSSKIIYDEQMIHSECD